MGALGMSGSMQARGMRMVLMAGAAALALGAGQPAGAQADGCVLVDGRLPENCRHANEGTVVARPAPPNIAAAPVTADLGDLGFSISIDGAEGAEGPRRTIAGAPARPDRIRDIDRLLEAMGLQLSYDGLGARPRLAVATADLRQSFVAGEKVTFRATSNYPAWIDRAEVVIRDRRGQTVALVPIAPNGTAEWTMPAARDARDDGDYDYILRVWDTAGRRDETRSTRLVRSATRLPEAERPGPVIAAAEGEDMTARRGIPVRGGAVTVTGHARAAGAVTVMGERAPVDPSGSFVIQRILPPGVHGVRIGVDGQETERPVEIARSEWFRTGIADLTIGRDNVLGETWKLGRIAGFAQGTLANGVRVTASMDTREEELRDMFRNFGRKHPDQTLRQLEPRDIFNTYGDDSQMTELAPTSGKFYLRVERDGSHLTWGDFKPAGDAAALVRSDRALYGLSGEYRSLAVTGQGEPRVRITGFAANADSLMQRDVFSATGGSAYFLSRQDLLADTETIMVEVRDTTTGAILSARRLSEGVDYRIDHIQGVVILNAPLSSHASSGGLVTSNPLGDQEVRLVAQYEYIPTTGDIDGHTIGLRAEGWANDHLRFGVAGLRETTGIADNTLLGADILLRQGETRELLVEYARSEGPGFGSSFSDNAGMEILPGNPSFGLPGQHADAWSLRGRTDLAMLGLDGRVEGFYTRKDGGFSSPSDEIRVDQTAWGLDGEVALTARTALTFGGRHFSDADGRKDRRVRLGFAHALTPVWTVEGEVQRDERSALAAPGPRADFGARTDAAVRLTWSPDEDLAIWAFGQATVTRDATRQANNRVGFGARALLTDRIDMTGEVSTGNLGWAARAELGWQRDEASRYTLGYELDPQRRFDSADFAGRDRGRVVLGASSRVNDRWNYTAENTYSAFGTRPTLTSGYGVTYTPDARWRFDGGLQFGRTVLQDDTTMERRGLSFGVRYTDADIVAAGLRGEWRRESSDNPARDLDRNTWLVSGFYEQKTSADWRFVSAIDAVVSNSDQSSFRDGRYVEARVGYAWRPESNDRINGLVSYTFLYDMPGADQVNIDGHINGPRQRSHILNAAISYQLNPQWTLGAKYGYRWRELSDRASGSASTRSEAHLGILRVDYHVVHNWDLMAEVRALRYPRAETTELGAVTGLYRLMGNNLRIGAGYAWGQVDDDMRRVRLPRTGAFLNITTQF